MQDWNINKKQLAYKMKGAYISHDVRNPEKLMEENL